MSEPITNWTDNTRTDGMRLVAIAATDCWMVVPPKGDERPAITRCPCCNKLFAKMAYARNAADAIYPLTLAKARPIP